jgi:hypothetical protein
MWHCQCLLAWCLVFARLTLAAESFYSVRVFAPNQPLIDNKIINARDRQFVVGALTPDTYCGLDDKSDCPPGIATLVDVAMTRLAVGLFTSMVFEN